MKADRALVSPFEAVDAFDVPRGACIPPASHQTPRLLVDLAVFVFKISHMMSSCVDYARRLLGWDGEPDASGTSGILGGTPRFFWGPWIAALHTSSIVQWVSALCAFWTEVRAMAMCP